MVASFNDCWRLGKSIQKKTGWVALKGRDGVTRVLCMGGTPVITLADFVAC